MDRSTRTAHDLLHGTITQWVASIGGILGVAIQASQLLGNNVTSWTSWLLLGLVLSPFAAVSIYSILVRRENRGFRRMIYSLHKINHNYRDALAARFRMTDRSRCDREGVAANSKSQIEETILESVCQEIAMIFSGLLGIQCVVTVKYIYKTPEGQFCETLVRNEKLCKRDQQAPSRYEVGTGQNTAFDTALTYRNGGTSFFHSADLIKDRDKGEYRNQRQNWESCYKSAIVVPIRSVDVGLLMDGKGMNIDNIGFLSVDTMSQNRLNSTWHVELLAAFADQIYNFMSIMRGKYRVADVMAHAQIVEMEKDTL